MKLKLGIVISLYEIDEDGFVDDYASENEEFDLVENKLTIAEKIIDFVYEFLLGCKIKLINELGLRQSDLDDMLKRK